MYKKASKFKLRFQTPMGSITVEQAWDLTFAQITDLLHTISDNLSIKEGVDERLSFLGKTPSATDEIEQLRFEILKDIYLDKKKEVEEIRTARDRKIRNARIDEIIAQKQEDGLRSLSIEQLEALRDKE